MPGRWVFQRYTQVSWLITKSEKFSRLRTGRKILWARKLVWIIFMKMELEWEILQSAFLSGFRTNELACIVKPVLSCWFQFFFVQWSNVCTLLVHQLFLNAEQFSCAIVRPGHAGWMMLFLARSLQYLSTITTFLIWSVLL